MSSSDPTDHGGGQPARPGPRASPSTPSTIDEPETVAREGDIEASPRRTDDPVPGRPRRTGRAARRVLGVLVSALAIGLLATAGVAAHLWRSADEWMAEADRVEGVADELATEREALTADLEQAERDLAATEAQLRQVQNRLTALAEEKAQTADERELARQVATDVARVASQLEVCVRGQDDLIAVLEDIESYEQTAVSDFAREVNTACSEALASSEQVQQQLGIP